MTRNFASRVALSIPSLLAFAISGVLCLVGIQRSPDIISDEATYGLVGQHVDNFDSLTFGVVPIVVHPPLFFLASGAWLAITGHDDGTITSAITSLRVMNGLFSLALAVAAALLAKAWLRTEARTPLPFIVPLVMVLVASDGFLLRFGRAALIEPMAVFLAVVALLVAWRLREAPAHLYVAGTGIAIGLALLAKQPSLFVVGAPLVASVLKLRLRAIGRELAALIVGLFVFASFAAWAYQSGNGAAFYNTQFLNVRRLFGIVQVTGLNRQSSQAGGGAASSVRDTLTQFVGAYVLFAIGALALVVLAWHLVRDRRRGSLGEGPTQALALGLLSYAFLAYSVLFGQSNEQLTMYTVPGAAILAAWLVLRRHPQRARRKLGVVVTWAATVGVAASLAVSLTTGVVFYPLRDDNATALVANYVEDNIPRCVQINSTGNATHWSFTVRTNPVRAFSDGPTALRNDVHLFLVSPRDAKYGYGPSSPTFNRWIEAHGRKLYSAPTKVYQDVSLWQVGRLPQPTETNPTKCVNAFPEPVASAPAPALRALGFIGLSVGFVTLLAGIIHLLTRRSRPRHAAPAG